MESDDQLKGPPLEFSLERVRPLLTHLSADLRAGAKIELLEYIGDVFVHGAHGEV